MSKHWKDPNCPNCGGRSFSAIDPGDSYGCEVCEHPYATNESRARYRDRGPRCREAFERWAQTDEGRDRLAPELIPRTAAMSPQRLRVGGLVPSDERRYG